MVLSSVGKALEQPNLAARTDVIQEMKMFLTGHVKKSRILSLFL